MKTLPTRQNSMLFARFQIFIRRAAHAHAKSLWKFAFGFFLGVIIIITTGHNFGIYCSFKSTIKPFQYSVYTILFPYAKEERNTQNYQTNYSVLTDRYYVVQEPTDQRSDRRTWPKCIEMHSFLETYSVCPYLTTDFMLRGALESPDGIWESVEVQALVNWLKMIPNLAYVDIGANIGLWIFPVARALKNTVKIIAVEANPVNVRSLIAGFNENKVPKNLYAIIEKAIDDTVDETVVLVSGGTNQNLSAPDRIRSTNGGVLGKIIDDRNEFNGTTFSVSTATIDSHVLPVAKAMNITAAILKIDIEGSECFALRRFSNFLKNIYVPLIMTEHNVYHQPHSCIEFMFKTLTDMSYMPFILEGSGNFTLLHWPDYKKWPNWDFKDIMWKRFF